MLCCICPDLKMSEVKEDYRNALESRVYQPVAYPHETNTANL